MKIQFGSLISRAIGRSTTLSPLECGILVALVEELPPKLRELSIKQIDSYEVVQREIDGRALNFYFGTGPQGLKERGIAQFEQQTNEAALMRITLRVSPNGEPIHAVLTAVDGRIFCITLSRRPNAQEHKKKAQVEAVVPSWKGSLRLTDAS